MAKKKANGKNVIPTPDNTAVATADSGEKTALALAGEAAVQEALDQTRAEFEVVSGAHVATENQKISMFWNTGDRVQRVTDAHGERYRKMLVDRLEVELKIHHHTVYDMVKFRRLVDEKDLSKWHNAHLTTRVIRAYIGAADDNRELAKKMAFDGKDEREIRKALKTQGSRRGQAQKLKAARQRKLPAKRVFDKLEKLAQDLSDQLGSSVEAMAGLETLEQKERTEALKVLKNALKELSDLQSAIKEMIKKADKL